MSTYNDKLFLDSEEESDTVSVLNGLAAADDVPKFLSGIEGPFAFVYYKPETESLWFGRDYFGRHSLLVSRGEKETGSLRRNVKHCLRLPQFSPR